MTKEFLLGTKNRICKCVICIYLTPIMKDFNARHSKIINIVVKTTKKAQNNRKSDIRNKSNE